MLEPAKGKSAAQQAVENKMNEVGSAPESRSETRAQAAKDAPRGGSTEVAVAERYLDSTTQRTPTHTCAQANENNMNSRGWGGQSRNSAAGWGWGWGA